MNKIFVKHKDHVMWSFLRSGWTEIMYRLSSLHNEKGVLFDGFLDLYFGENNSFEKPWIGFFHHTPTHPCHTNESYDFKFDRSLSYILKSDQFKKSLKTCCGIFTLSEYNKNYIKNNITKNIIIENLFLSTEVPNVKFNFENFTKHSDKKLIMIGHWMRRYSSIFKIKTDLKKFILFASKDLNFQRLIKIESGIDINNSKDVFPLNRLDNYSYDNLFSKNIIYLDLYDSAANNVVVECMARGTPLLVNKTQGVLEYLGEDYPFYFENTEEAERKLKDNDLILQTHLYLKNHKNFHKLSFDYFVDSFVNSEIYKKIKMVKHL